LNPVKPVTRQGSFQWAYLAIALVLAWITWAYLPVAKAGFVWDDVVDFRNMAWLRSGDHWQQFLLRRFNDWEHYFRPLVVALFTLEVRAFNGAPGPMHVVSLTLHVVNVMLVGWLSRRIARAHAKGQAQWLLPVVSMLVYGLHPVLIEPVAWIGCQFELCVTLLTLLGLIAQARVSHIAVRAALVSLCFFLAACSKESAVSFPLLIILFDYFSTEKQPGGLWPSVAIMWRRHWPVYVGLLATGIGYLILRVWALGSFIPAASEPVSGAFRLQEISYLYLNYWRMLVLPSLGMSPVHAWPLDQFQSVTIASAATVVSALTIFLGGLWLGARRSPWGALILTVTAALLPVLHIIPGTFDQSPFHERYVMTALSVACALLPWLLSSIRFPGARMRQAGMAAGLLLAAWSVSSTATIRMVVPFWSNNISLWQWALTNDPSSKEAQDGLISAYVDAEDYPRAIRAFSTLGARRMDCRNCVLNIAIASMARGQLDMAGALLDGIKDSSEERDGAQMYRSYLTNRAKLDTLQGHLTEAEAGFRHAISLDPLDPQPMLGLTALLLIQGKSEQAKVMEDRAIGLLTPNEQDEQKQALKRLAVSLNTQSNADDARKSNP